MSPSQSDVSHAALHRRMLLDQADANCALDLDDRIIFANEAAAKLLGYPLDVLIGMEQEKAFGGKVYSETQKQLDDRMSGRSSTYELGMRDPLGNEKTLLVTGNPLLDENGKVVGSFGVLKDITERKAREQSLETRLLLEQAISSATRSFVNTEDFAESLDQVLSAISLLLNASSAKLFELKETGFACTHQWSLLPARDSVSGRTLPINNYSWWHVVLSNHHPIYLRSLDELPDSAAAERRTLETMQIESVLALPISYAGTLKGFLFFENLSPFGRLTDDELSIFEVFSEVLAVTMARRQIEADRNLLFTAVEQVDSAIIVTDREFRIAYVNHSFVRLLGYSKEDAKGRGEDLLVKDEDASRLSKLIGRANEGKASQGALTCTTLAGEQIPVELTISPVVTPAGTVERLVVMLQDMSTVRNLETQLRQAQKLQAVGRLAAGVAHEINTPMQYISDNAAFLLETLPEVLERVAALHELCDACTDREESLSRDEGLAELLTLADKSMQRCRKWPHEELEKDLIEAVTQSQEGIGRVTRIIQAMKEFSHPGGQTRSEIDINRALSSTVTVSRSEWKYAAEVKLELAESLPRLVGFPGELNQAFLNLIVNSVHAIEEQGSATQGLIQIRTMANQQRDHVIIEVEDNGAGIPPEIQDHVLEPFFTTKEVGKGTGQGLAVAHRIVTELHAGELEFESRPGCTCFRMSLPCPAKESEVS